MEPAAATNSSIVPSAMDLLLVVPRLAQRAGSLALHMPEAMDNIAGKIFNGGSMVADATGQELVNSTTTNTSTTFAQKAAATAADAAMREGWNAAGDEASSSMFGTLLAGVGKIKNFGGIFSYLTSRWALGTFAAAIILNRVQFYASSREHLRLKWHVRLALYIIPIMAFRVQLMHMLQALKCQTSPDFAQIRYGDPLRNLSIDFGGEGGLLYQISSALLFWQDDASCCAARNMSLTALDNKRSELRGSLSLLFSFFLTLCSSQLIETLACALQGKPIMAETGMTIFEHSLAFAECEAMISSLLGFGYFGTSKPEGSGSADSSSAILMSRSEVLQRLNAPPEILFVCLISCFSHMSSATLAVTGLRHKVRLLNTAIWAFCYMSAFLWSLWKLLPGPTNGASDLGVIRFPTVCVIGFIPHLLILVGIIVCAIIYVIALVVTAASVPNEAARDLSFRQRMSWAYHNLQANVQFSSSSNIRIKMSEDFYTCLLKVGFSVMTAASEAVYLNEGTRITMPTMSWLEHDRITQFAEAMETHKRPAIPAELLGEDIAKGVDFTDHFNEAIYPSPYARERRSKPAHDAPEKTGSSELDSGLGISQRRNRMQLTLDFVSGLSSLVVGLQAQFLLSILRKVGIDRRPAWLLKAAGATERKSRGPNKLRPGKNETVDFWMMGPNGSFNLPKNSKVDVEAETRRRLQEADSYYGEEYISRNLYDWWLSGGWFGDVDASGEYKKPLKEDDDDDTTSMLSMSTNDTTNDAWSDAGSSDGRRTPTQQDPYNVHPDPTHPLGPQQTNLDTAHLARLLNPQTPRDRDEARLLAHTLEADRPLTRSQFKRDTDRKRSQILAGLRGIDPSSASSAFAQQDADADLEAFILSRRSGTRARAAATPQPQVPPGTSSWETGADGMGDGGPQCVVCQSAPRTVLVWPCGCLSMCDDCRVGLAARNYTKCICCRTGVVAYSKLYVP